MPIEYKNNVISYVDLDIDFIKIDDKEWEIHDEDEYYVHKIEMEYPETVTNIVDFIKKQLLELLQNSLYPFDGTYSHEMLKRYTK